MKKWKEAANLAHKLAVHFAIIGEPDADPAEYEDQQFEDWYAEFKRVVNMSNNNPVKCNDCEWEGSEHDLVLFRDKDGPGKGCPTCKTDKCLSNII